MSNSTRLRGLAIGISTQLQPFVVEATPVSTETEWWTSHDGATIANTMVTEFGGADNGEVLNKLTEVLVMVLKAL